MTDDPQAARDALLLTVAQIAFDGFPPGQLRNSIPMKMSAVRALAAPRPPQEAVQTPELDAALAAAQPAAAPKGMFRWSDGLLRSVPETTEPMQPQAAAPDDEAEHREMRTRIRDAWNGERDSSERASAAARAALARHRELTAGLREENAEADARAYRWMVYAEGRDATLKELRSRLAALEAQPREPTEEDEDINWTASMIALDIAGATLEVQERIQDRIAKALRVAASRRPAAPMPSVEELARLIHRASDTYTTENRQIKMTEEEAEAIARTVIAAALAQPTPAALPEAWVQRARDINFPPEDKNPLDWTIGEAGALADAAALVREIAGGGKP